MDVYEHFAVSEYLSYFPENATYDEVIALLHDNSDEVAVWEVLEYRSRQEVADIIDALADSLRRRFIPR